MKTEKLTPELIAPCGMNCGLCLAYLREKNTCGGCNSEDKNKPQSCIKCSIKNCEHSKEKTYCFECDTFPCKRLKQLDKRYREKYGMSMIENLENIKKNGIQNFVKKERKRWACPDCNGVICVHRGWCSDCGASH